MRKEEKIYLEEVGRNDWRTLDIQESYEFLRTKGVKFGKLKKYIAKQSELHKQINLLMKANVRPEDIPEIYHLFVSYHKAAEKYSKLSGESVINTEEDLYPDNLALCYDSINEKIIKAQNLQDKYQNAINKYVKFEKEFDYNGVKYFATVPRTQKELIMEGYNMHNCLVMRGPSVANEEMKILFIRKEDNKPFIDVILDENDRVIWAILDYHVSVERRGREEFNNVVETWYRLAVKDFKSKYEMWQPRCFC